MDPAILKRLSSAGHLDLADCAAASFSVEDRLGRNHLVIVRTAKATLTSKQFRHSAARSAEIAALALLRDADREFAVPILLEAEGDDVVCSSDPGRITLFDRWYERGATVQLAGRLGGALASLHALEPPDRTAPSAAPMAASRASIDMLDVSSGAREVLRLMQQPELDEAILALSSALADQPTVFCHGDIRSRNVLVAPTGAFAIELIDWELSGAGPAAWDVGAGIAVFIEIALAGGRGAPAPKVVRAFMKRCWPHGAGARLLLSVRCAGARLLHAAFESGINSNEMNPQTERLVTIGSLFVRRPLEGAVHLGLV